PYQALPSRQDSRVQVVYRIPVRIVCIDRPPPVPTEHRDQIADKQCVKSAVMQQDCVSYRSRKHALSKRLVELRALPDMLKKKVAISCQIRMGPSFNPLFQSRVDGPVRSVDRRSTHTIAMFS